MPVKRSRVAISGQVQGVFFRAEMARRARELGVGGFVRNTPDGRVEAVIEGDPAGVDSLVEWCRHGPPMAVVEEVDVADEAPRGDTEFRVTR
jgi:acylphosphatase